MLAVATLLALLRSGVVVVMVLVACTGPLAGTVKVSVRELLAFGAKLPKL
jgi:hypothetical protein